jgi:probable 2-oxoglutarate dehydrogenase E1 component DHKTD1
LRYVDSLRLHGHRAARIDPLDILQREEVAAVDPTRYGLVDESKRYDINGIIWTQPLGPGPDYGLGDMDNSWWSLGDITRHLRSVYTGRVAYEYMHSPSKTERLWFSHLLESQTTHGSTIPKNSKKRIHSLLARSETLDNFLQAKFPNLKRYGLEGGESMLPALDTLFSIASQSILF